MPSSGRSRSRKVCTKARRQSALTSIEGARNDRGKPPRSQRSSPAPAPTSSSARPVKLVVDDPPREGLRGLAEQVGRSAAEDQVPSLRLRAIDEDAEDREEVRTPLDLVDDHQALQMAEGELGLIKACEVVRVLQVVASGETLATVYDLPRERSLAHLPSAEKRDYRMVGEQVLDAIEVALARDHARSIREKRASCARFSKESTLAPLAARS